MRHGNRTINVSTVELIKKVKENKEKHVEEFKKAKEIFKVEATKRLEELKESVQNGALTIQLELTFPIDNSQNYDDIIKMFEWEENDIIQLTQDEFKEYVLDDNSFANLARTSNTYYSLDKGL